MINIIPHLFSLFASYRSLSKCSIYWNGNVALSSSFKSPEIVGASNSNALTVNANATRVYRPKSSLGDINPKDIKVKSNEPFLLSSPQFLIRFKTPKVKSKLKLQLEELQDIYKENDSFERNNDRNSKKIDDIPISSVKFDPHNINANSMNSRKNGRLKGLVKEDRSESTGGMNKQPDFNKKYKINDDDDSDYLSEDSDNNSYFGEEEISGMSLSSVSADYLREMESDGFSLEDIQLALYGEFGLKVSMQALRRRLNDDKSERRTKARTGKTRREKSKARQNRLNPSSNSVKIPNEGTMPILSLSELLGIGGGEIVKYLMVNKGIMSSMNQKINVDLAKEIAIAFGKTLESSDDDEAIDMIESSLESVSNETTHLKGIPRSPVITIMGHVDHGKTTLLDTIRKTQIALGEAGGITQSIRAFKVKTNDEKSITFIDTPGHAAFSEMRKRGANLTDIVILVVAADDGIMEQTLECIAAAKAANCPVVVAINKIDKDGANPQKVVEDLMKYDIVVEDFGGDVQSSLISAKKGLGVDDLLEKVLLQAEVMNLVSKPVLFAEGTVIEASIDRRQGVVATCLVQHGTLKLGDFVVAGSSWGKVRRLISDQGRDLKDAGPSTPVQLVGLSTVPSAGDVFSVLEFEEDAKNLAEARQRIFKQAAGSASTATILAQASGLVDGNYDTREVIKIPIVLKADVTGSIEALTTSILSLEISDVASVCKFDIVSSSVGDVTMSDVSTASAAKAQIIAFNVGPGQNVLDAARASNINIQYHNVVYDVIDSLEKLVQSTFAPPPPGLLLGRADIKKSFKLGKIGNVAGCTVTEGIIKQDSKVRILRGKRNQIYLGSLESLRVGKETVSEVPEGSDCGMFFQDFADFAEGDVVECFQNV